MGAVGKVGLKPHTAQVSIIDFDKEYEIFDLEAFLHLFKTQQSPTKIYDYYYNYYYYPEAELFYYTLTVVRG